MASIAQAPMLDEEIDLRRYAEMLLRQWKVILASLVVCLAAAAFFSYRLLPATYSATAGVAIVRNRAALNFDPKFRTEYQVGLDPVGRRSALLAVAQSSAIAARVSDRLKDQLPPEERDVATLLKSIRASLQGDLIQIEVTSQKAANAAAIANAWAEEFTTEVNTVYGEPSQSAAEIEAQTATARRNYEEAQQRYERFLAENRLDWYSQQIKFKQQQQSDTFDTLSRLERVIRDARSLRDRLRQGGSISSSDALPLSVLKLNAFAAASNLTTGAATRSETVPLTLQLPVGVQPLDRESAGQQLQEVEAVLSALETRRAELQAQASSTQLQQELAKLQQEGEQEQARHRSLQDQRDLARETYNTVARKQAEVSVSSQLTDTEVRQALTATTPERASGPKRSLYLLMGGLAGVLLGVVGGLALEFVRGRQTAASL